MAKSKYQKLKDKADKVVSEYIRRKAADGNGYATCVTCGSSKPWKEQQAGHFLSRKYNVGRFMEENIHVQCMACNIYGNGRYQEYTLFMVDHYGRAFVDGLLGRKHEVYKFLQADLENIIQDFSERLRALGD